MCVILLILRQSSGRFPCQLHLWNQWLENTFLNCNWLLPLSSFLKIYFLKWSLWVQIFLFLLLWRNSWLYLPSSPSSPLFLCSKLSGQAFTALHHWNHSFQGQKSYSAFEQRFPYHHLLFEMFVPQYCDILPLYSLYLLGCSFSIIFLALPHPEVMMGNSGLSLYPSSALLHALSNFIQSHGFWIQTLHYWVSNFISFPSFSLKLNSYG